MCAQCKIAMMCADRPEADEGEAYDSGSLTHAWEIEEVAAPARLPGLPQVQLLCGN